MTTTTWLGRAFVWTLWTLSVLAPRIYSQNAKPSSLRVNSTLVVVRAEVLDKKHMFSLSNEERECMRVDQQSFYDLSLTQPYIPKACWGSVVRDLKASDFRLFVDGTEQKIQGFDLERSNMFVRDNLGAHNESSYTPAGKWSSPPVTRSRSKLTGPIRSCFTDVNTAATDALRPHGGHQLGQANGATDRLHQTRGTCSAAPDRHYLRR